MKYPFLRYLVKFFKVKEFENCQMLKSGDSLDFCIVLLKGNIHLNTNSRLGRGGLFSLSKKVTEETAGTALGRKTQDISNFNLGVSQTAARRDSIDSNQKSNFSGGILAGFGVGNNATQTKGSTDEQKSNTGTVVSKPRNNKVVHKAVMVYNGGILKNKISRASDMDGHVYGSASMLYLYINDFERARQEYKEKCRADAEAKNLKKNGGFKGTRGVECVSPSAFSVTKGEKMMKAERFDFAKALLKGFAVGSQSPDREKQQKKKVKQEMLRQDQAKKLANMGLDLNSPEIVRNKVLRDMVAHDIMLKNTPDLSEELLAKKMGKNSREKSEPKRPRIATSTSLAGMVQVPMNFSKPGNQRDSTIMNLNSINEFCEGKWQPQQGTHVLFTPIMTTNEIPPEVTDFSPQRTQTRHDRLPTVGFYNQLPESIREKLSPKLKQSPSKYLNTTSITE